MSKLRNIKVILISVSVSVFIFFCISYNLYNTDGKNSFWYNFFLSIITGIVSSALISILLIYLDYMEGKAQYKHNIVVFLSRLSRALRNKNYSLLDELLFYYDSPFNASFEQYKFNKELQSYIDEAKLNIGKLSKSYSKCKAYDDFNNENDLDLIKDMLSDSAHRIFTYHR